MLTETKTPSKRTSLIPAPGQSLEAARDNYFGGTVPSETPVQADASAVQTERGGRLKKVLSYGAAVVSAGALVVVTNEVAQLLGNVEHAPWQKPVPAQTQHR